MCLVVVFKMPVLLFYSPNGTEGFSCGVGVCSSITPEHGLYFLLSVSTCLLTYVTKFSYILLTLIFAQVILGEEVAASKLTIFYITKKICDAVQARAEQGMPPCLLSMSL
jgi:hypothetical protein